MHISSYEICLERVAEEFMGRRKWKHYQEQLTRTQLNIATIIADTEATDNKYDSNKHCKQQQKQQEELQDHRLIQKQPIENWEHWNNALEFQRDFDNNHSTSLTDPTSRTPSPPLEPNDWTPSDKCNFCVNGRLLTVNAQGELVAETTTTTATTYNNNNINNNYCHNGASQTVHQLDSDSNSSASLHNFSSNNYSTKTTVRTVKRNRTAHSNNNNNSAVAATLAATSASASSSIELYKLLTQKAPTMTSMDSMAAQLAAIKELNFNLINTLANHQKQQQQQQHTTSVTPTTSEVSAAAISPALKDTPSPSADAPLDLSSKPSPNSSISGDLKSVRTISECATPIPAARRSYSEDDLQSAVQDVLDHKVGTRKAASQYNVPRSTLRNKLHKIQAKRGIELSHDLDLDQDDSADECDDSNASTPVYSDFAQRIAASAQLRKLSGLSENNGSELGEELEHRQGGTSPGLRTESGTPLGSSAATAGSNAAIDPNVLLRTLMLATGIGVMPKLDENQTIGELFKTVLLASSGNSFINGAFANAAVAMNANAMSTADTNMLQNGTGAGIYDQHLLLQQLQQQQQHQQQQHHQQSQQQQLSVNSYRHRLPKSDTPETTSSLDTNEACDDPILKIPSFKVSGASSVSPSLSSCLNNNNNNNNNSNSNCNSNRNGGAGDQRPHSLSPMLSAAVAATGFRPLSSSPTAIQKMMANTIHRKINEQSSQEAAMLGLGLDACHKRNNGNTSGSECSSSGLNANSGGSYKKPSISVAKVVGGTDTSRFGASPNLLAQQHHLPTHHAHQLSAQDAAALAAGKGTRPKRGKYRNYDRDSLVEAVKAVQRGEMSVHRAGSYYGVPHSTLEYKVKERHLMRPRKREPKPQPDLVGLTGAANKLNPANLVAGNHLDKLKASSSGANSKLSNALKNNSQSMGVVGAAGVPPNGMKLPMFEAAGQLPFQQSMFWPPAGLLDAMRLNAGNPNAMANASAQLSQQHAAHAHGMPHKGALEFQESVYDNIIRKKLQSNEGNGNALLDQLLVNKTPLPFTNNRSNEYVAAPTCSTGGSETALLAAKRLGSPMEAYADIKRERLSPESGGGSSSSGEDEHVASNNNNNNNSETAHNKNKSSNSASNKCNNGSSNNGRSRMTSRDSETDASSFKSEHSELNNKMMDLNGSSSKHQAAEATTMEASPSSSILHEKLAQIKAEQECPSVAEEHL